MSCNGTGTRAMRSRLAVVGASLVSMLLAACQSTASAPAGYAPAGPSLPPEVERLLPADASPSDVVVRDGCYYLLVEGEAWPIPADGSSPSGPGGQPLCLG